MKKPKKEPDDKEQSKRFIETAKQIEKDIDKDEFDKTCSSILKAKKPIEQKGK
jgi:hypothetical protein